MLATLPDPGGSQEGTRGLSVSCSRGQAAVQGDTCGSIDLDVVDGAHLSMSV
jgi:hypothetical protein